MSYRDRVISLCATQPELRSEEEIKFVADWIAANSSYFQNIQRNAIFEVVRECQLQRFGRNELVIRQGEKGHSFYVVISGKVSVYVNSELEQADDDIIVSKAGANSFTRFRPSPTGKNATEVDAAEGKEEDGVGEEEPIDEDELRLFEDEKEDGENVEGGEATRVRLLGTKVMEMGGGYAFGEIALTSENNIRKASVICDEDTAVLVINRASYTNSLRAYQDQENQMVDDFINSSPLFAKWQVKQKHSLRASLRKEQFGYQDSIMRQSQQYVGLFFIIRGSVKLLADPTKWPAAIRSDEAEDVQQTKSSDSTALNPSAVLFRRRQGYRAAEKRQLGKQIEVALLGEGAILGQVEFVARSGKSLTTATCIEPTTGYWLNRANCRRLFKRKRATVALLKQTFLLSVQSRIGPANVMRRLGEDLRIAGAADATATAAAATISAEQSDPVAAGREQRNKQQKLLGPMLHTRKKPPQYDELWQHMLLMYVQGRSQLGPAPSEPSLYYRHLCRLNADRRRHLRERALPPKLREELDEEEGETGGTSPQRQPVRRAAPRSLRLLRKELEAAGGGPITGLGASLEDPNRLAFRPASGAPAVASTAAAPSADDATNTGEVMPVRTVARGPRLLTDFELSKVHLHSLERRIEAFCAAANDQSTPADGTSRSGGTVLGGVRRGAGRNKPHVEPLLRLPDAEVQKPRFRGSRVLVRTKNCPAAAASNARDGGPVIVIGHSHVTNHLVQSLPDWDQLVLRARRERLHKLEEEMVTSQQGLVNSS